MNNNVPMTGKNIIAKMSNARARKKYLSNMNGSKGSSRLEVVLLAGAFPVDAAICLPPPTSSSFTFHVRTEVSSSTISLSVHYYIDVLL